MSLRILLIAVAALICLCAADVSHINQKPPQDVLVPFNDLLPPPLEESSTTSTTTEAAPTTPATKPTKKSYYQQQAKSKDATHHTEEKQNAKSQPEIQLALDLLPPFAEPPATASNESEQPQIEDVHTTTHRPLVSSRPTATTKKSVPLVAKPQYRVQSQPQPQTQHQPQQLQARVSRPNSIAGTAAASAIVPLKSSDSFDLITQYLTNFQFTTRRPSRGALPTLTPFPNHIKK